MKQASEHSNLDYRVKTYPGGVLGLMRSGRPAVVIEVERKGKSPLKRIVSDDVLSDNTMILGRPSVT